MKNKKIIIFDLDGTLIDSDKLIFMSYNYLFKKYGKGYEPTFSEYISFLGPTLMEVFPKYFDEDVDFLIKEYRTYSNEHEKYFLQPIKGAKEVLEELYRKGYKLAIVSSKIRHAINNNLRNLGLEKYFSYIVGADDVKGKYKPDPYGIELVLKHFDFEPKDAVMIGDSNGDIHCAKNAGVSAVAVDYSLKGKFYKDSDVDYSISSLYDLLAIFSKEG